MVFAVLDGALLALFSFELVLRLLHLKSPVANQTSRLLLPVVLCTLFSKVREASTEFERIRYRQTSARDDLSVLDEVKLLSAELDDVKHRLLNLHERLRGCAAKPVHSSRQSAPTTQLRVIRGGLRAAR